MNTNLAELFENLRPALLWVNRKLVVRYANADASLRTGLATGHLLADPALAGAVTATIASGSPREVIAFGGRSPYGASGAEARCRVIPGLGVDDAFVLMDSTLAREKSESVDWMMLAIRSDLHEPLAHARAALQLARQAGEAHAMEALLDGLDEVLQATSKAIELASIWSRDSLPSDDRVELWPLVHQAWAEVEPIAVERGIRAGFAGSAEAPEQGAAIYGSRDWLRRLFSESLEAIVRFGPTAGTIEVEYRQIGARALIVMRGRAVPGSAADPSAEAAIYDRIGLKLCQHIAALHGGRLRKQVDRDGCVLLIELPSGAPHRTDPEPLDLAQVQRWSGDLAALLHRARYRCTSQTSPDPVASADASAIAEAATPPDLHLDSERTRRSRVRRQKRILIVEDQAEIRRLIRMTLEFEDYEIHEAANGLQGLQLASEVRPDLVLLDVMMPGEMDGLQVCRALRRDPALCTAKVVLLTARGQGGDREAGERAGADDYLVKPASPMLLIETVERLLDAAA